MGVNYGLPSLAIDATQKGLGLSLFSLGKLQQNALIERFNLTCRHEVLNAHIFQSQEQVREITEEWIHSYNQDRPHVALAKLSPIHHTNSN